MSNRRWMVYIDDDRSDVDGASVLADDPVAAAVRVVELMERSDPLRRESITMRVEQKATGYCQRFTVWKEVTFRAEEAS